MSLLCLALTHSAQEAQAADEDYVCGIVFSHGHGTIWDTRDIYWGSNFHIWTYEGVVDLLEQEHLRVYPFEETLPVCEIRDITVGAGSTATHISVDCTNSFHTTPHGMSVSEIGCRKGTPICPPSSDNLKHCTKVEKNVGLSCPVEGNPINIGIGNKFQVEVDIEGLGGSRMGFARYYNSDPVVTDTRIGRHWRHTYDRSIVESTDEVAVYRPDGKVQRFERLGTAWVADSDVMSRLEQLSDVSGATAGWRYRTEDDTTEDFDAAGRLTRITFRNGRSLALDYDASGRLEVVTSDFGRSLSFTYDADGRVASVMDPIGAAYRYVYDASGRLTSVTYPDDTPLDDTDDPVREYLYEDLAFLDALTGIIDESGNRFATYAYDVLGRAVLSTHAGDAGRVDIAYDQPGGTVSVDNPKGPVRGYTMEVEHGVVKPSGIARQ